MIDEICKKHKLWISYVRKIGETEYPEDIVQEMYIRVMKYKPKFAIENGKVNEKYIFIMLQNIFLDEIKNNSKNRITKTDNDSYINEELLKQIDNEIETWNWYDKQLFTIYSTTGKSIRTIAKEYNVSYISIFRTLKNRKDKLREKFLKQWQQRNQEG